MPDEKIAGIMRSLSSSLEKKDLETALSFFTEDATWVTPAGTFKGMENIRRYLKWEFDTVQDEKVTESGNGIDLVAMPTHGRSGIGRWVFGSVTDKVLHAGDTPVLVVRPTK